MAFVIKQHTLPQSQLLPTMPCQLLSALLRGTVGGLVVRRQWSPHCKDYCVLGKGGGKECMVGTSIPVL